MALFTFRNVLYQAKNLLFLLSKANYIIFQTGKPDQNWNTVFSIPAGTGEAAAATTLLLFREVGGVLGGRSSVALVRFSQPEIASSLPGFDSGFRVRTELAFSMEFLRTWEKVKLGFYKLPPASSKRSTLEPRSFFLNRICLKLARVWLILWDPNSKRGSIEDKSGKTRIYKLPPASSKVSRVF